MSQNGFQYSLSSPAMKRFGSVFESSSSANHLLSEFSIAAIEHEPIAYVKAIVRGLGFYVSPRDGEGYTPDSLREEVISTPARARQTRSFYAQFYSDAQSYTGPASSISVLSTYEKYTRVQGALMVILLAFAISGPLFLRERQRWAAVTFTLTAIFSITFAIAGVSYDARFSYPTFGPLGAGAALGAWGMWIFLTRKVRELRERQAVASAKA
jgi:hypothetical protein